MHRQQSTAHASLVEELGAGEVVGGMVDVYPVEERAVKSSHLSAEKINALLGTDITKEQMLGYLEDRSNWTMMRLPNEIVAPTFRQDLLRTGRSWQRKWQDSSDMTIFRPHFQAEKQPQVKLSYKLTY